MNTWDLAVWIRIHWFELSTLILLGFNLWFVFEVLRVLRAVNRWLSLLARRLDQTTKEKDGARPGVKSDSI